MKLLIVTMCVLGGLVLSSGSFAKSNSSDSPPPPPPPVHHSSAPVIAPVAGGLPHNAAGSLSHSPGSAPYRPMPTVTATGQHTLVYPGVRNSTIHHPTSTNLNTGRGAGAQGNGKGASQAVIGGATKTKLDSQTSARLRNWNGNRSTTAQAQQINAMNQHHHHHHDWWRHHCAAIIFFDSGWWGWDDGWWYPAWGYDPYSYYEYNQPIYGANGLAPDQIVAGVQAKLQQLGYYTYAIDGTMGPLTRSALARYQSDHRMNITSGIDPATLAALGIVR